MVHEAWRELTGIDYIVPIFTNGTLIDMRAIEPIYRDVSIGIKNDYERFFGTIKGQKAEKEGVWQGVNLLETLVEQKSRK